MTCFVVLRLLFVRWSAQQLFNVRSRLLLAGRLLYSNFSATAVRTLAPAASSWASTSVAWSVDAKLSLGRQATVFLFDCCLGKEELDRTSRVGCWRKPSSVRLPVTTRKTDRSAIAVVHSFAFIVYCFVRIFSRIVLFHFFGRLFAPCSLSAVWILPWATGASWRLSNRSRTVRLLEVNVI